MQVLGVPAGPVPGREGPGARSDHSRPSKVTILSFAVTPYLCSFHLSSPLKAFHSPEGTHSWANFGGPHIWETVCETPKSDLASKGHLNAWICRKYTYPNHPRAAWSPEHPISHMGEPADISVLNITGHSAELPMPSPPLVAAALQLQQSHPMVVTPLHPRRPSRGPAGGPAAWVLWCRKEESRK